MKLSSRARYAVRMMVVIHREGGKDQPVQLNTIASVTGISKRYLEQLAIALKSHSLLIGLPGRNGGYKLARDPSRISIGDVIKSVIGPINLSLCVVEPDVCMRTDFCECRLIWTLLDRRVNAVLEDYSIADLSDGEKMTKVRRSLLEDGDRARELKGTSLHSRGGCV